MPQVTTKEFEVASPTSLLKPIQTVDLFGVVGGDPNVTLLTNQFDSPLNNLLAFALHQAQIRYGLIPAPINQPETIGRHTEPTSLDLFISSLLFPNLPSLTQALPANNQTIPISAGGSTL